ncbi:NAD(P)-binding protein [Xylariaceae sp. FL0255]|nr:NAD(P)-binding protein [Xylariaceae sp. FL0255]
MASTSNILITGGAGFLAPLLTAKLLEDPSNNVVLTDLQVPQQSKGITDAERSIRVAMISQTWPISITYLRSARKGMLFLSFTASCHGGSKPRGVYASTQAVYDPPYTTGTTITDDTPATSVGVYGTHKLMMEFFINEMNRQSLCRGFLERNCTRTHGRLEVHDPDLQSFSTPGGMESARYDRALRSSMRATSKAMPPHISTIYMPGISATPEETYEAFTKVCGEDKL